MEKRNSNAVFRLLRSNLAIHEHNDKLHTYTVVRPAGIAGTPFRGYDRGVNEGHNIRLGGTVLHINAPPAILTPTECGWNVDISELFVFGRGPGPVWFNEDFNACPDAVAAIEDCFFGSRVDSNNPSLTAFFGGPESERNNELQ